MLWLRTFVFIDPATWNTLCPDTSITHSFIFSITSTWPSLVNPSKMSILHASYIWSLINFILIVLSLAYYMVYLSCLMSIFETRIYKFQEVGTCLYVFDCCILQHPKCWLFSSYRNLKFLAVKLRNQNSQGPVPYTKDQKSRVIKLEVNQQSNKVMFLKKKKKRAKKHRF